jgi:hypothetical protein
MAYILKGYSHFPYFLMKQLISDLSDDATTVIKCALMKDTYTPDQDADEDYSDISADEITADATLDPDTDYPAGGLDNDGAHLLLNAGTSVSVSDRTTTFDIEDPTLSACTIGAYACVFYDDTPAADADKKLIAYCEFGAVKASNSGTYKIVVNVAGLFTLAVPV